MKQLLHSFWGDLAALRLANPGVKMYGPESLEEVQYLLRDQPAREVALKTYTVEWLTKTRDNGLSPLPVCVDGDFNAKYFDLLRKVSGSGMLNTPQSALPGSAALPAASSIAFVSKAVSAPL